MPIALESQRPLPEEMTRELARGAEGRVILRAYYGFEHGHAALNAS